MITNKINSDTLRLQSLGYKQELIRRFTGLTNYGISLSVLSASSGLSSLFAYGMITGGPVVMIWGWIIVCFFTLFIVFGMAELSSAYPTAGGVYYWTGVLVPQRHKAFYSWFTGWFSLIGQFAVITTVDFGLATLIASVISLSLDFEWSPEPYHILLIHLAIVLSHGICNSLGTRFLLLLTYISTWWQLATPLIISLALFMYAKPGHQSVKYIFIDFKNETGWSNLVYVLLIGLRQAQCVFVGYDASVHMAEETKHANISTPCAMVSAVVVSAMIGWLFLIMLFFGIHDYEATIKTSTGFPIMQILLDNFCKELVVVFMVLLLVAWWFCGLASVTRNSRMIYAFNRDHAMPGSYWWLKINSSIICPLNAVWLSCFMGFILALPYLVNKNIYVTITILSTICLHISYFLPILCKILYPNIFLRGPFHLGRFSTTINIVSLLWITISVVLLLLPPIYPITSVTMDYASIGVVMLLLCTGLTYFCSARYWFGGPMTNVNLNYNKDKFDLL